MNGIPLSGSRVVGDELQAIGAEARRSTVHVRDSGRGDGAGIIWESDGLIVTNAHVVRGATAIVRFADGCELKGRTMRRDDARDLAALRVDADALPAVVPVDPRSLRPGELALALGHPLGWSNALSVGVIHGVERFGPRGEPRWVRSAVRLMPGNSGGPLMDVRGRVIGINAMVVNGMGYAVPSTAVTHFLLPATERPSLGISMRPVLLGRDRSADLGLLVLGVERGSAAAEAGLRAGDVLTSVAGAALETPYDVTLALTGATRGDLIELEIVRDGRLLRLHAAVRPSAEAARAA